MLYNFLMIETKIQISVNMPPIGQLIIYKITRWIRPSALIRQLIIICGLFLGHKAIS